MKRFLVASALALAAVMAIGAIASAAGTTGNNAPSGAHYNLNIIGVDNPKSTNMDGGDGHRIFVGLGAAGETNTKTTKIMLTEGDFAVLDANGTDGTASFRLPNPDPTNSGTSEYSVFVRELGKPGGKAKMVTGAYVVDPVTGEVSTEPVYSAAILPLDRTVGKNGDNKFMNATAYLLYIYVDLDGDGRAEHYNLFNDAFQDFFWQYDNNGLKVLQLRFYPGVPTTVPATW